MYFVGQLTLVVLGNWYYSRPIDNNAHLAASVSAYTMLLLSLTAVVCDGPTNEPYSQICSGLFAAFSLTVATYATTLLSVLRVSYTLAGPLQYLSCNTVNVGFETKINAQQTPIVQMKGKDALFSSTLGALLAGLIILCWSALLSGETAYCFFGQSALIELKQSLKTVMQATSTEIVYQHGASAIRNGAQLYQRMLEEKDAGRLTEAEWLEFKQTTKRLRRSLYKHGRRWPILLQLFQEVAHMSSAENEAQGKLSLMTRFSGVLQAKWAGKGTVLLYDHKINRRFGGVKNIPDMSFCIYDAETQAPSILASAQLKQDTKGLNLRSSEGVRWAQNRITGYNRGLAACPDELQSDFLVLNLSGPRPTAKEVTLGCNDEAEYRIRGTMERPPAKKSSKKIKVLLTSNERTLGQIISDMQVLNALYGVNCKNLGPLHSQAVLDIEMGDNGVFQYRLETTGSASTAFDRSFGPAFKILAPSTGRAVKDVPDLSIQTPVRDGATHIHTYSLGGSPKSTPSSMLEESKSNGHGKKLLQI